MDVTLRHQFYPSKPNELYILGMSQEILLHVNTKFGCKLGCCLWTCFGVRGRTYPIKVKAVDQVRSIYDAVKSLNPDMADKEFTLTHRNRLLDREDRLVQTDIKDGDKVVMIAGVHYCCKKPFRSDPNRKVPANQRRPYYGTAGQIFVDDKPVERPPWVPAVTDDHDEVERRMNAV